MFHRLRLAIAMGTLLLAWPGAPAVRASETLAHEAQANELTAEVSQRIGQLITQLGDQDYFVRQRAEDDLVSYGHQAYDLLSAAEYDDDVERATRVRWLLRLLRIEWTHSDDPPSIQKLLKDYGQLDVDQRLRRVEELGRLIDQQGLPALCRVVRYESSQVVSKAAALVILRAPVPTQEIGQHRVEVITKQLGQSPRVAAQWLHKLAPQNQDPAALAEMLSEICAAEWTTFEDAPEETRPEFVQLLLRRQAELLESQNRTDDALESMHKIVQLERGSVIGLLELLSWLSDHEAWPVVNQLADLFKPRIHQEPVLLYALAAARENQGEADQVDELVALARAIKPDDQLAHYEVGYRLKQFGLIRWAIEEFRVASELGTPADLRTVEIQRGLAELLHDQGEEQAAAEVLAPALKTLETNQGNGNRGLNGETKPGSVRARMKYFQAQALKESSPEKQGEKAEKLPEKYVQLLDEALQDDKLDADVLIALFNLPDKTEERRAQVKKAIDEAVAVFREQIKQEPEVPNAYNQLAWLVANTDGDQDEALNASKHSLDLEERPESRAGYLDTLAHCYFARGEFAEAVKAQEQAASLDRYSKQIQDKLTKFRAALQEADPDSAGSSASGAPLSGRPALSSPPKRDKPDSDKPSNSDGTPNNGKPKKGNSSKSS